MLHALFVLATLCIRQAVGFFAACVRQGRKRFLAPDSLLMAIRRLNFLRNMCQARQERASLHQLRC